MPQSTAAKRSTATRAAAASSESRCQARAVAPESCRLRQDPRVAGARIVVMAQQEPTRPEALERLARLGVVVPAERPLADALAARGPLTGPVTDAGSRAVVEQRVDRG